MPRRNLLTALLVAAVVGLCYARVEHNRYGRYLAQVLEEIDQRALESVPPQELFEGAMRGIVEQVNKHIDRHSAFISAEEEAEFTAALTQQFGGVGVMVKLESEGGAEGEGEKNAKSVFRVISDPNIDTPAHKAGIRAGDAITAIDGQSTAGMTMKQAVTLIRGPVDTPVTLAVLHTEAKEPVELTLARAVIIVPSVLGDRPTGEGNWDYRLPHDPRIGYLQIDNFGERTAAELQQALATLEEQGATALVIDLRDNSGGLLVAAVETCRQFLDAGRVVVRVKSRGGVLEEEYFADERGPYYDLPLTVLVNENSASASEIVAACLQDHGRAAIVGTRTYGKGTVQQVIDIEGGRSILKLTTASYSRPSDKNIHRRSTDTDQDDWGVRPNDGMTVSLSEADEKHWREERRQRDVTPPRDQKPTDEFPFDPQLDRAIEELQKALPSAAKQPQAA